MHLLKTGLLALSPPRTGSSGEKSLNSRSSPAAVQVTIRAAIVGTGFIADFHARGIREVADVELVAVCDANIKVAEAFAAGRSAKAYASLDEMLEKERIDVIHVLVPPDTHHAIAKKALQAGAHVFVEKPMCVSVEECDDLLSIAGAKGLTIGVNHSMVYIPAYERLRRHVHGGDLGPIDYLCINHFSELGVMRVGPFGNWIVRQPGNALLEIGPHVVSELIDLVGVPDDIAVTADRDVVLPGGARAYRRWRIHARAGGTAADINLNFGPGFPQRTIAARGLLGSALLDFNANVCTIDRLTRQGLDFDRRSRSLDQAKQILRQARQTFADTLLSKAKLKGRGNPDQLSIQRSIAAFYAELRGAPADERITGDFGRTVIETCETIIRKAKLKGGVERKAVKPAARLKPTVLVLGGTGFIGRQLVKQLLDKGHAVRAASRGGSAALEELGSDRLEIVRADMRSEADLARILDGIDTVFHLATSTNAKTWDQYVEGEVEPTRALAKACHKRGIKRFIYTGTIDSYYAGASAGTITEATPLDRNIKRRNYYARAKAAVEDLLMEMHRKDGLPVVILRPGIVIGRGGNPFHWGVGKWSSEGVVETWGAGTNKLPLVLVDDVAAGLVRAMEVPGIEGRSYNLIDQPMLSARDYIAGLESLGGFKIEVHPTPIWRFWLADLMKWPVKVAVRHPDAARVPSYSDWESRTQKAVFDSSRTREELGWTPISDPERMVNEGIGGSLAAWLKARE
jgi:predicted dehydrogenase/nucleoside-diphosphate-sugar epimerase